jgi:hypothetical protein
MDKADELVNNCDKGKPNTIKQRRQSVVPKADKKRLNTVAATKHHESSISNEPKSKNKPQDRLQAKRAGSGQIVIFIR